MSAVETSPDPAVAHHVLSVLVENRAGVLSRVANLFARRGFNIMSLAVAPTQDEHLSRITIVVDVESSPLEQIVKQLDKLVNVVEIQELDPRHSVERELMLATVRAQPDVRGQIIELVQIFDGRILAVTPDELTVSLEDHPTKVDDFEEMLRPFGLVEIGRSGRVALPRIGHEHDGTDATTE